MVAKMGQDLEIDTATAEGLWMFGMSSLAVAYLQSVLCVCMNESTYQLSGTDNDKRRMRIIMRIIIITSTINAGKGQDPSSHSY
jgi:hypothetical protein